MSNKNHVRDGGRYTGARGRAIGRQINASNADYGAVAAPGWSWGGISSGPSAPVPMPVAGAHVFVKCAAGGTGGGVGHGVGLKNDGTVWCWGDATSGCLGNGTVTDVTSPVSVLGGHSFVDVAAGLSTSLGLKIDGSAWAWGLNNAGQLGDETMLSKSSPNSVVGNHSFVKAVMSVSHSGGLKIDGSLWMWGLGTEGSLGNNTADNLSSPNAVIGSHSFIDVAVGYQYTLARKADGTIWGWGTNARGQIGDHTATSRSSPVLMMTTSLPYVFAGMGVGDSHTYGLTNKGTVAFWGRGSEYQPGNVDYPNSSQKTPISTTMPPGVSFSAVVGGYRCGMALQSSDGSVWAWGENTGNLGKLGIDSTGSSATPVPVFGTYGSQSFVLVSIGGANAAAIKSDGSAWMWGAATGCGDGTSAIRYSPVSVLGNMSWQYIRPAGAGYALGHTADNQTWVWGVNLLSALGVYSSSSYNSPVMVHGCGRAVAYSEGFSYIARGRSHYIAITANGKAWGGPYNDYGQLGNGNTFVTTAPSSVIGGHSFIQAVAGESFSAALKVDGSCWTWGINTGGQLGNLSIVQRSSPVSVVGNHSFIKIACTFYNMLGLKADGTLWSWGANTYGELGDGTQTAKSSPISVIGAHSFVDIAGGGRHSLALKYGGTVWAWGDNSNGALGDNSTVAKSSPVSVNGTGFQTIAAGFYYSAGVKTDNTGWAWGLNTSYQLGDGTNTQRLTPYAIAGGYAFTSIACAEVHTLGRRTDGLAAGWGYNATGGCGDNTLTNPRSTPVLVNASFSYVQLVAGGLAANAASMALQQNGTVWFWGNAAYGLDNYTAGQRSFPQAMYGTLFLHSFTSVSAGGSSSNYGLHSDGSCWAWGEAAYGALGDSQSTVNRSSPNSVLGNITFAQVSGGGSQFTVGIDTNGHAWAWGLGTFGQLGDRTATSKSSPVSVHGDHSFIKVSCGANCAFGIKIDGTVWSWGRNADYAQLGDWTKTDRSSPVSVVGTGSAYSFVDVFSGAGVTVAREANGKAWYWGYAALSPGGQDSSSPISVVGAHTFANIYVGVFANGIGLESSTGELWTWGQSATLGILWNNAQTYPDTVWGGSKLHSFTSVSKIGYEHCIALKADGSAWGWGYNVYYQICIPTAFVPTGTSQLFKPYACQPSMSFDSIGVGIYHTVGVERGTGRLWAWGLNSNGALGDRTSGSVAKSIPVSVHNPGSFIQIVSAGVGYNSIALRGDGTAWCWGPNATGQLGNNTTVAASSPVSVVGEHSFINVTTGSGGDHCLGLKADGSVWGWGWNGYAQLGDGTIFNRSSPVSVLVSSITKIDAGSAHSVFFRPPDTIITGGAYAYTTGAGIYGSGGPNYDYLPYCVPTLSPYWTTKLISSPKMISAGYYDSIALDSGGYAWAWGYNEQGQLGVNNATDQYIPMPVSGPGPGIKRPMSFVSVSVGRQRAYFLREAGDLWTTGIAVSLANPLPWYDKRSPMPIQAGRSFATVACGYRWMMMLDQNGTAWTVGDNTTSQGSGGMADGTNSTRTSPVVVMYTKVSVPFFSKISATENFCLALDTTGKMWGWGNNQYQLGDGTNVNRSYPVAHFDARSWAGIGTGNYGGANDSETAYAWDSNGTAWAWGVSNIVPDGGVYLGLGGTAVRTSPSSVLGPHSFIYVTSGCVDNGNTATCAAGLRTDGTIWAWGNGNIGQIGNGDSANRYTPTSVVGGRSYVMLAVGNNAMYGLTSTGQVWAWGDNGSGQLGDFTATGRSYPVSIVGPATPHSFVQISSHGYQAFGLKDDGSAWAWGYNPYGQLGDQTTANKSSPVSVAGTHSFVKISSGGNFTAALKLDGSVWTWGYNASGELGTLTAGGAATYKSSPVLVVGGHSFVDISCGQSFTAALKLDGSVWTWGANTYGQLADGTSTARSSPISVVGQIQSHSFIFISQGTQTTLALKSDGSCWGWGYDGYWQIGDAGAGDVTNRTYPSSTVGAHSFVEVRSGTWHTVARKVDGSAWAWGYNLYGALGDRTTVTKSSPVSVHGTHSFVQVASGYFHSIALKNDDGSAWAWGYNNAGQLGDSTTTNKSSPVSVAGGHSFIAVDGGLSCSVGLKADNSIWTWGAFTSGLLGDNSIASRSIPGAVYGTARYFSFTQIVAGYNMSFGIHSDGTLWAWGYNNASQLADNTIINRGSPVSVIGAHAFVLLDSSQHTIGVKSDGTCWCWGLGTSGQLGDRTATTKSSPVSVHGAHSFTYVAAGLTHSAALKANNGTCWCWGTAAQGQLGDQTATGKSSPVSVAGAHSFIAVHAGEQHTLALKANGSAWTWGYNNVGQLGIYAANSRSSPVSVVGAHSFVAVAVAVGFEHDVGLKIDGSVWSWGLGTSGQLGDQTATSKSSPVSVAGNHSFIKITCGYTSTYGLKLDGSVWAWGDNTYGQLCDGTITARSSPVSMARAQTFSDIHAGQYHVLVSKSDGGSTWAAGFNNYGALGDNIVASGSYNRSHLWAVYGTIGPLWNFRKISCSADADHMLALDDKGNVWAWGLNTSGQLGNLTYVNASSPVRVVSNRSFVDMQATTSRSGARDSFGEGWWWGDTVYNSAYTNRSIPTSVPRIFTV